MRKLLGGKILKSLFVIIFAAICIGVAHSAIASSFGQLWIQKSVSVIQGESYTSTNVPMYLSYERRCNKNYYVDSEHTSKPICTVNTAGYTMTYDAQVAIPGDTKLGSIVNKYNTSSRLIPLSGSSTLLEVRGAQSTATLRTIGSAFSNVETKYKNEKANITITSTNQSDLMDNLNKTYIYSNYYLNVSDNNEWIVSQNGFGVYKYNLKTGQVQYVSVGYFTRNGLTPNLMLAISESGRYVALYVGRENRFDIIDTENCAKKDTKEGRDAQCSARSIMPDVKQGVSNLYLGAPLRHLQFDDEQHVSFYAYTSWLSSNDFTVKKIHVFSENEWYQRNLDYLAMGDSFASGEGIFSYTQFTNRLGVNMCHSSLQSYPYQLTNRKVVGDTESVACSGAKIKDIIETTISNYPEDRPQSREYLWEDTRQLVLSDFLVGNRRQYEFAAAYQPKIITISIGGNDIGFSSILSSCVTGSAECFDSKEQRKVLASTVQNTYSGLVATYNKLKNDSPQSSIYVIGYPQVVKEYGNCASNVKLTNNEIQFANQLTAYLNYVVKQAAQEAGVIYVDTQNAFTGRKLCEASSSQVAVNGLTGGNASGLPGWVRNLLGYGGPLAPESYHPNLIGHAMYAKAIQDQTNNFSLPMPNPSAQNIYAPSTELSDLLKEDAPDTNYAENAHYVYDASIVDDAVYRGSSATVKSSTLQYGTAPNTSFSVVMHSEPTTIGTVTSDENGEITSKISIPDNLAPGYHTLHIMGKTISGKGIDIQKIVYVAASEDDIDGDGVANDDEVCLVSEPAGVDVDQDGIDDACDGFIDEPPVQQPDDPVEPPVNNEETPTEETPPPIDIPGDEEENPTITPTEPDPTDKELPVSESRPDWLLMKEWEIAEEQATANQSATIPKPIPSPTTTSRTAQTADANQLSSPAPLVITSPQQEQANPSATQVAGVSSAVETKPAIQESRHSWWLYALTASLLIGATTVSTYAYVSARNKI